MGSSGMKIIGHRGAAGTKTENTLASLRSAADIGVYAIEIDVRKTKDNYLVLNHDKDLGRTAGINSKINALTLKRLQKIRLQGGTKVPTLAEALKVIGTGRVVIELKDGDSSDVLLTVLADFPKVDAAIASSNLNELAYLRKLAPNLKLYGLEWINPFDIIHIAKRLHLDGVGLNYWLLNPLTYFLCKRSHLDIYVYTVNRPFHAKFLSVFYPDISICTDYPERFITRRRRKRRTA